MAPKIIPPWAYADCRACKDGPTPGMNSQKQPCRGCLTAALVLNNAAIAAGKPERVVTADDFTIAFDPAGNLTWTPKPGKAGEAGSIPVIAPVATPVQPPIPTVEAPAAPVEPPKRKRGRPKKDASADIVPASENQVLGVPTEVNIPSTPENKALAMADTSDEPRLLNRPFTLFINALPEKLPTAPVQFADVFLQATEMVAKANNAESFWSMDAFRRRDAMSALAPQIAEALRGRFVVAFDGSLDHSALRDALSALADIVIRGTR